MTFERGFEPDPMGSYLDSLERVAALDPELVLPGHGTPFRDGARRAEAIAAEQAAAARRRSARWSTTRERTVTELTAELFADPLTGAQRHFAMAEILAYLAYHEVRGAVARGGRRRVAGAGSPARGGGRWMTGGGRPRSLTEQRRQPSSGIGWWWSAAGSAA